MPFIGKTPSQGFVNSVTKDDFTPNGTTTAFTLSKSPATVNEIEVYVGNVRQEPTDAYSVSGTTLTMTEAPVTGTNFYVMHIGGTTQSSTTLPGGSTVPGDFNVSGTLTAAGFTGFTSTGIDDNATSNAITIDSDENVGIGVTPSSWGSGDFTGLQVGSGLSLYGRGSGDEDRVGMMGNAYHDTTNDRYEYIGTGHATHYAQSDGTHLFQTAPSGSADGAIAFSSKLTITNDGRGLSEFTAKAWANVDMGGSTGHTPAIRNSHNVSSVTDHGVGNVEIHFTNNIAQYGTAVWAADLTQQLGDVVDVTNYYGSPSTSSARCRVFDNSNNLSDSDNVHLNVFGD
jgi:hypothetical protein